jgi:tRNA(His) 5'-end guanylyltransferase
MEPMTQKSIYRLIEEASYPTHYLDRETLTNSPLPFSSSEYSVLPTSPSLRKATGWATLGDKLCLNEKQLVNVEGSQYFTIRLDGKSFSKVGRRLHALGALETEYSEKFNLWMQDVCHFLTKEISNVVYSYTQSDEITILIAPMPYNFKEDRHEPHAFNGRRDKLISLASSLASARFYRHMVLSVGLERVDELPLAVFDGRLAVYHSLHSAFELILWRSYDCAVNSVSTTLHLLRDAPLPRKEISRLNTLQKLVLLHSVGIMPDMTQHQKYGTLFHRAREIVTVVNQLTGEADTRDKYFIRQVNGMVVNNVKEGRILVGSATEVVLTDPEEGVLV